MELIMEKPNKDTAVLETPVEVPAKKPEMKTEIKIENNLDTEMLKENTTETTTSKETEIKEKKSLLKRIFNLKSPKEKVFKSNKGAEAFYNGLVNKYGEERAEKWIEAKNKFGANIVWSEIENNYTVSTIESDQEKITRRIKEPKFKKLYEEIKRTDPEKAKKFERSLRFSVPVWDEKLGDYVDETPYNNGMGAGGTNGTTG